MNTAPASFRRYPINAILRSAIQRRAMMVRVIVATQAREGIETSIEQAQRAYDLVHATRPYRQVNRVPR